MCRKELHIACIQEICEFLPKGFHSGNILSVTIGSFTSHFMQTQFKRPVTRIPPSYNFEL